MHIRLRDQVKCPLPLVSTLVSTLVLIIGWTPSALALDCNERLFHDSFEDSALSEYQVAVDVSALGDNQPGRSADLQLNGGETLTVTTDGLSCFVNRLRNGQSYGVAITAQPSQGNNCVLNNASGTVTGPVTVGVQCDSSDSLWDQMTWDVDFWE